MKKSMDAGDFLPHGINDQLQEHVSMKTSLTAVMNTPTKSLQTVSCKSAGNVRNLFWRFSALSLLLLLGTTGCGTIIAHSKGPLGRPPEVSGVYQGAKYDCWWLNTYASNDGDLKMEGFLFGPVYFIDIPISAVFDTLLLPYDALSSSSENGPPPQRYNDKSIPDAKRL